MPSIDVDTEVFRALEAKVQGFGETPNAVLRRLLVVGEVKFPHLPNLFVVLSKRRNHRWHPPQLAGARLKRPVSAT